VRRYLEDDALRAELHAAAAASVAQYDADAVYERLEAILREAAA
jgi:hypothetical protein